MDYPPLPGIKIIRLNTSGINDPDEPDFPWKLEASFTPSEFLLMATMTIYDGSEEMVVKGRSREDLIEFLKLENHLITHSRLRSMVIIDPEGAQEDVTKKGTVILH